MDKTLSMQTVPAYDFTMPLDGAVRVRDYKPTLILRSRSTLDGLQRLSDLQLFPHSLTHIDLLPRINWELEGLSFLLPESVREAPWHPVSNRTFLQNRAFRCTIVSLHKKAFSMREACQRVWKTKVPRHPLDIWPEEEFFQLLKDIRIKKQDLLKTKISKGSFVIFFTGWREFAPNDGDLTHRRWYPWHPYLMNPYLEPEAIDYLLDTKEGCAAAGIGCDIGTLDSPLRFIYRADKKETYQLKRVFPYFEKCLTNFGLTSSQPPNVRLQFWTVHINTLSKMRPLVEQLHIPAILLKDFSENLSEGFATTEGKFMLLPHQCERVVDAVLASAIFAPNKEQNTNKR